MPFYDKKPELLVPINSIESLKLAIASGADAVYFGKKFSARRDAENLQNLKEVTSICHLFGVKAYLTINTSIKAAELSDLIPLLKEANEARIDALIVTDLSILSYVSQYAPTISIHASTQTGVNNGYAAKFLEKIGFSRLILAREVRLHDIIKLRESTSCELEIFVHGAMCVGFSGACLISSFLTERSGNRGVCSQLCRQAYRGYIDNKELNSGYLLSPKDLCLINEIDYIKKLGIASIKIEGRLKRDEYISGTTEVYRRAIDGQSDSSDLSTLKRLFNRGGFGIGYNNGNSDIIYPFVQNNLGEKIGRVVSTKGGTIEILSSQKINKGDGLKIIENGCEASGFSVDNVSVTDNELYLIKGKIGVKLNSDVNITTDINLNTALLKKKPKLDISAEVFAFPENPLSIKLTFESITVEVQGLVLEKAIQRPSTIAEIEAKMMKTGESFFNVKNCVCHTENAFVPASLLNSLRNEALASLTQGILDKYPAHPPQIINTKLYEGKKAVGNFVEISQLVQFTTELVSYFKNIVYYPDILNFEDCKTFVALSRGKRSFLKLPVYAPPEVISQLQSCIMLFDGVIVNNYYGIELAEKYGKLYIVGPSMNVYNPQNPLSIYSSNFVISTELNKNELKVFESKGLIYSYGKLPLMYLEHCPRKVLGKSCKNCNGRLEYRDGKCYNIISKKYTGNCEHILKNPINLDLINEVKDFDMYFDFTDISVEEINKLIFEIKSGSHIKNNGDTSGHYKRGVI